MKLEELDIKFKEAYKKASSLKGTIAPDVMLRLYAYYKQGHASKDFYRHTSRNIIDAFKINACMQIRGMSVNDAKQAYVDLVNEIYS